MARQNKPNRKEQNEKEIRAKISEEFERWNDIAKNGCSDPGYPDGVNMNLVRNHIIYGYKQLENIGAVIFNLFGEPIGEREPPQKVPENLMIRDGANAHRLDKYAGTILNRGLVWCAGGEFHA